jgi:hypothetical protein
MKRSYLHQVSGLVRALSRRNVRSNERVVSMLLGTGLAALGLRQWKSHALALAVGGLLLRRGLTGKCPLYRRLGLSST